MSGTFADVEAFVEAHRDCGELEADVGPIDPAGYVVVVTVLLRGAARPGG